MYIYIHIQMHTQIYIYIHIYVCVYLYIVGFGVQTCGVPNEGSHAPCSPATCTEAPFPTASPPALFRMK